MTWSMSRSRRSTGAVTSWAREGGQVRGGQEVWWLVLALSLALFALVVLDGCQSGTAPAAAEPGGGGEESVPQGAVGGAEEGEEEELGELTLDGEMISVDGLEVRQMHCELSASDEDAGGMAMLELVASMADRKAAIDACAPNGAAFRVALDFGGESGTTVQVMAAAGPQSAPACLDTALREVMGPQSGRCTAVLLVGEAIPAAQAAESLLGREAGSD